MQLVKTRAGTRLLIFILDHLLPGEVAGAVYQQLWNLYNMDECQAYEMDYDVQRGAKVAFDEWFSNVFAPLAE